MNIHSMSISIPAGHGLPLCNAACPFCISRLTGKAEKWNTGILQWTAKFKNACSFCRNNGVNTLLITGKGEPFINIRDSLSACLIAREYFSIIEIQTNGSLCTEENLINLLNKGLTTLAISISHPDPEENSRLINLKEVVDYKKISGIANSLGLIVRVSFNLSRVWDYKNKKIIDWVKEILNDGSVKADQYTFRIIDVPPVAEIKDYTKIAGWIRKNKLNDKELDKINRYVQDNGIFIRKLNWGASIYDVNGFSVAIVDCLQKPTGNDDDIRSVIFMPNAHVYSSWELKGSILL
jgi:hypothetical protein